MTEDDAINIILGSHCNPSTNKPYPLKSSKGEYALSKLNKVAQRAAKDRTFQKWAEQEGTGIDDILQDVLIKICKTGNNNRVKNIASRSSGSKKAKTYIWSTFESVLCDKTRARERKEKQSQEKKTYVCHEKVFGDALLQSALVTPAEDIADAEDQKKYEDSLDKREENLSRIREILAKHEEEVETFEREYILNWDKNLPGWKSDLSVQKNTQNSTAQYLLDYHAARILSHSNPNTPMPSGKPYQRAKERLIKMLEKKCADYNLTPMFSIKTRSEPETEYGKRELNFENSVRIYLTLLDMQKNGWKSRRLEYSLDLLQTRDCTDWAAEVAIAEMHVHLSGSRFLFYYQSKK